jgi:hypothetical protein
MLSKYQPSPLQFETYKGARIPIARLPEKLTELSVPAAPQGIAFDGVVSDEEIAISWKSGQFRLHGPGNPPPPGEPATYCYVGKTTDAGKECLYVSFNCMDADVSRMITGKPEVWDNDSVEVFLDTTFARRSYNHLIVDTQGRYQARFVPDGTAGIENRGSPWDAAPRIKTMINRDAKRWTCEILIPFDRLGGVPAKGQRWGVNFTRAFRGQTNPGSILQNWFLVYDDKWWNYHHPDRFGVFQW